MTCPKPPVTTPQWYPSWRSVRIVVRAPGVSWIVSYLREDGGIQSGECRHTLLKCLGEVDFAAHGSGCDLPDLGFGAGFGCEHLDDLALDQCRVDVEHHHLLCPADGLDGDVDVFAGGGVGERRAQVRVGYCAVRGDVDLVAGQRIVGDTTDCTDKGVGVVERLRHCLQGAGGDGLCRGP